MVSPQKQIIQLLQDEGALTLDEIALKIDKKPKTVFKLLRKLFQNDKINCDFKTRRYSLSTED